MRAAAFSALRVRQQCPDISEAVWSVERMPARILKGESFCVPVLSAMSSAVTKPMPSISRAILYGFCLMIFKASLPYSL